jgi:hypothetical protein
LQKGDLRYDVMTGWWTDAGTFDSLKPYNCKEPDEYRLPAHENHIPYDWARKDG